MTRVVQPEWLDALPSGDPAAVRSRADLRRVNRLMGHGRIFTRVLRSASSGTVRRVVELGAGDATLTLAWATRLSSHWPEVELTLVDRQPVVNADTLDGFRRLGWKPRTVGADVFEWLSSDPDPTDLIVSNLFLHHFEEEKLRRLLGGVAAASRSFIALEPRRSIPVRLAAGSLGCIGCNHVTRHDARVSVRAGFHGRELSALWPSTGGWRLGEAAVGLFSHLFTAQRCPV